jgi:hypothetical protein
VQSAEKISFVGMSMHRYLLHGLKYLFQGKKGRVDVVVANKENDTLLNDRNKFHPWSLCRRVQEALYEVAPGMNFVQTFTQSNEAGPISNSEEQPECQVIPRSSFSDFIEKDME